ncbi:ribonuclease T [Marinomonas posidonica]|uniref:Ribonuclease T n=1 Tax=Marinomonas posidonica (strain CECT 7376 / NCIMB 14433 / IVIA-Po-181) TaxID=491952 RepID=F6CUV9_MARPP|nr:ribonuclease T [Marinomonas posidonica]AEF55285.1 Ribonuclease T [Marinomonas posidonica IVIA-Po-181]
MSNHEIKDRFRGFLPVVIDVETAGFNQKTDALLEMAASILRMDENGDLYIHETIGFLIKPFEGANLEKAALDFTGIDPFEPGREDISENEAITQMFAKVRKELKSVGCKRAILVGHNAAFDHGFLNAAIERADIKRNPFHPFSSFDTASLAGLVFGQTVLAKACEVASIPFSNSEAHSAKYDTEKTAELFCEMVNRWKRLGGWPLIANETEDDMSAIFNSGQ